MSLVFEDLHPAFAGNLDYYPAPNENLGKWDELLQGLRLDKAAGICSGGEVGFFNLLPRVRHSLTLVDHSYRSLYFAIVKYLALQKYGAEELYRRITLHEDFMALATELNAEVPPPVAEVWTSSRDTYYYDRRVRTGPEAFEGRGHVITDVWKRLSQAPLVKTCEKLDKLTFLHGDLADLATKGRFGLLYLSNALEHTGRHGLSQRRLDLIDACLKPGGYVLTTASCSSYYNDGPKRYSNWEILNTSRITEGRANGELQWEYTLHQVPEKAVV